MLNRQNPLDIGTLGTVNGPDLPDQIKQLYQRIEAADEARQSYISKQEKLLRQRKGIRKAKTFPWVGANNHNWPLIDGVIRRWKPGIAGLVMNADPVCWFRAEKPEGVTAAPTAQAYYHWTFFHMHRVMETVLELCEYIAQHGKAYSRQGWDYQTEDQCRIIQVKSLFPNGVDAAVQQFNAAVEQQRAQAQQAIDAGQAPPEALDQVPQPVDAQTLVWQMLEDEYLLDSNDPVEVPQIDQAAQAILAGADTVRIIRRVVKCDRPSWRALSPLSVIVPPRNGDLANADYIAIEHNPTADDLARMVRDRKLDAEPVAEVIERMKARTVGDPSRLSTSGSARAAERSSIQDILDRADGVNAGDIEEPATERLLEVYCKLDLSGQGVLERCVLWYVPGVTGKETEGVVCALYRYPYPFFEWPVVEFEFEHSSDRPYSARGISEHLSVYHAMVNKLHNSRLDAIQITLAPMFQMRASAGDEALNIKFMPGAVIPVQTVGDIAPLPVDTSALIQNMQEENLTRTMAEQYIGIFDPAILAQNAAERRTATEVDAVQQQTQSVFAQDASLFQSSMSRVHRQLWDLIEEFAPEELYYQVTGEDKPRTAKKSEIMFDYDIQPAGTPANTSRAMAVARAREALQLFGGDMTGLIDKSALFNWYFSVTDRNLGKQIVRSPESAALVQQMMGLIQQMGQQPAPPP